MWTPSLQSLRYAHDDDSPPSLWVLDQLLIPEAKQYVEIPDVESTWRAIRTMQIRGAPLIAIVAVLGLAVDLNVNESTVAELNAAAGANDGAAIREIVKKKVDYLRTSRPTAVNLFHALDGVMKLVDETIAAAANDNGSSIRDAVVSAVTQYAEQMLQSDVADNEAIGAHGADAILRRVNTEEKVKMMTICNTGSLATAGFGTALGVVRELHRRDKLQSVTALETRPYNQGSRLTAFEITEEKMPGGTLICDSAAAARMKTEGVDAVVVGADRVCANGDTANKIGTYQLSIVAAAHGVPFYVAAPFTTLDTSLKSGDDITIEERSAEELVGTSRAPKSIGCWNPGFDVTPASFVTGIITEKGVIERASDGTIDVKGFVEKHSGAAANGASTESAEPPKLVVPHTYTEQSTETLPRYLAKHSPETMGALSAESELDLSCVEMGDGNLNLVFIVTNDVNGKKVIVKQALPYVRCVGEAWPLTLERAHYEYKALSIEGAACPKLVPKVYYFSRPDGLMAMEYLAPPNIILRKGLIEGIRYPTMASDMGVFCANTLFKTSAFKLSATELRKQVEFWSTNTEMCALTEQVIFTEPYIEAPNNRWTSPQLDLEKKAIENDTMLKIATSRLKNKFVGLTQALLHADLHSGSVMCSPEPGKTYVIDPEFAFYGPMGFDTGAFLANLLLNYVSQPGHNNGGYADWVLEQVEIFWTTFHDEFIRLWDDPAEHIGDGYQRRLLEDPECRHLAQEGFMAKLFRDTLGFAGCKMIRRIVGIAHVEDLESIEDKDLRARCEKHGLEIAKELVKNAGSFRSIKAVTMMASDKKRLLQD